MILEQRRNSVERKRVWIRALWQGAGILFLAVLCGVLVNTLRTVGIEFFSEWSSEARLTTDQGENMVITLEEARDLCNTRKAVFVDARSSNAYREGHILCARNLPLNELDRHIDSFMSEVPLEQVIIAYCDGEGCFLGVEMAKELYFRGYDNAKVLLNGLTRWAKAGLPVGQGERSTSAPVS
jgi:rhodanese-related sulfurtransferase